MGMSVPAGFPRTFPQSHLFFFLFCSIILMPETLAAAEFTSDVTVEGRGFFHSPAYPEQRRNNCSLAVNAELYHEFPSGSSFIIAPFFRLDSADDERTHADVREANFLYLAESWEMRMGVGKVFWGATEFVHLVDIINQTDLVEALDGEEKLGQPLIQLSIPRHWGTMDGFILPWFRERTYAGKKGRLRFPLEVDTDKVKYESGSEENHLDFALRYSHTLGDMDFGLYHFLGTSRDPVLILEPYKNGRIALIPYYEQIGQTGLDLQLVAGNWLWKGEALYRTGMGRSFAATTFGFEYTFVGIAETAMDLGLITEYVFDDRDDGRSPIVYDHDVMLGLRLAVNDADSTELLLGLIRDLEMSSKIITLEASRRIGENVKVNLEGSFFVDISKKDPAYSLAEDDFVKLEVTYYF